MGLFDNLTVGIIPHDVAKRLTIRILILIAGSIAPLEWQDDIRSLDATLKTELAWRDA